LASDTSISDFGVRFWRMKMHAAERVYEFHYCSGHGTRSDASKERRERLFYVIACVVMLVGVAVGFHMFYLHGLNDAGQPITQQSASLVYVHGGLMTCWMVLFALQCGLVTTGNCRLHMKLGMTAVVLYAVIVPIGVITALLQIRYADPRSFPPFGPYRFLALPLAEVANFTFFIGAGFLFRRSPQRHQALMMMGTLSAAQAGIGRIGPMRNPFFRASHAALFPTFWGATVTVVLVLWLVKLAMTRRLDRSFDIAVALFIASGLLSSYVSTTAWWIQLAHRITQ
jgi:hypothetical protein